MRDARARTAIGIVGAGVSLVVEGLFGLIGAGLGLVATGLAVWFWPRLRNHRAFLPREQGSSTDINVSFEWRSVEPWTPGRVAGTILEDTISYGPISRFRVALEGHRFLVARATNSSSNDLTATMVGEFFDRDGERIHCGYVPWLSSSRPSSERSQPITPGDYCDALVLFQIMTATYRDGSSLPTYVCEMDSLQNLYLEPDDSDYPDLKTIARDSVLRFVASAPGVRVERWVSLLLEPDPKGATLVGKVSNRAPTKRLRHLAARSRQPVPDIPVGPSVLEL